MNSISWYFFPDAGTCVLYLNIAVECWPLVLHVCEVPSFSRIHTDTIPEVTVFYTHHWYWIWHSEARAAWHILVIKPTRCTNSILIPLASSPQNLYDIYLLLHVQCWTPDDGQKTCPKHVDFYSKNKSEKLVHLVGFIINILILNYFLYGQPNWSRQ
jgi:hypothetical protein